ncbi:hypothetical protein ACA910_012990 [Epithemia clementina (nom. ined.)]
MSFYEDMKAKEAARSAGRAYDHGVVPVISDDDGRIDEELEEETEDEHNNMDMAPIELLNFEAELISNKTPIRLATAPMDCESKPKARPSPAEVEHLDSLQPDLLSKKQKSAELATKPGAVSEQSERYDAKPYPDVARQQLERLENDAMAKQQSRPSVPATKPGVSAEGPASLQLMEAGISAKNQGRIPDGPATAPGVVAVNGAKLTQMEHDIASKQQQGDRVVAAKPGAVPVGGSQLSQMEQDIVAKTQGGHVGAVAPGAVPAGGSQLSQMERDIAAKQQQRPVSAVAPGAVSAGGSQLSQIEQDIVAKQQPGRVAVTVPGAVSTGGSQLSQMEQDIAAKQQGSRTPALAPGVVAAGGSQLSQMEQDIVAKQQGDRSSAVAPGVVAAGGSQLSQMEQDIAAKQQGSRAVAPGVVATGGSQLSQMEQDIAAKQQGSRAPAVAPGVVATGGSQLSQMEQDIAAKQQASRAPAVAPGVVVTGGSQLSQMEQDIAAKQEGRSGPGAVVPGAAGMSRTLQHSTGSQLTAMEDAVNRKSQAGPVGLGRSELTSRESSLSQKALLDGPAVAAGFGLSSTPPGMIGGMGEKSDLVSMEADLVGKHNMSTSAKPPEGPKAMEPEQAPKLYRPMGGGISAGLEPDVEYGFHDPSHEGLAVAMPVREEEEDAYIQPAVEYDPDAKPPIHRRRRFRLYAFLAFFALVAAAVGAVIGVVLSENSKSDSTGETVPYRETLGIKDRVQRLVGIEELSSPDSPYSKALTWITHNDTMQVVPESPNFVQRYVLAYFYFATTENGEWKSCNPPEPGAPDFCSYAKLTSVEPLAYTEISWTRWLTGRHECAWAGITCDEMLQLRAIELSGQELSGPFPDGLKYIPFLQSVILNWGNLYGPLPVGLVNMKHLINIELLENKFSGPIPEEWWGARNLGRLNLAGNELTGTISSLIGNMQDMRGLYLFDNQLRGQIPTQVAQLSTLSFMYLHNNFIEGSIPSEVTKMSSLEKLYLHRNQLTGSLPDEIGNMSRLNEIRVQTNSKLGGTLPDSFYELTNLWRIDLRDCNFSGGLDPRISEFAELTELRLTNNPMSGPLPAEITLWEFIDRIELTGTDLTGTIPQEFCDRRRDNGIRIIETNCREENGEGAELECSCCTLCCDSNGENCVVP